MRYSEFWATSSLLMSGKKGLCAKYSSRRFVSLKYWACGEGAQTQYHALALWLNDDCINELSLTAVGNLYCTPNPPQPKKTLTYLHHVVPDPGQVGAPAQQGAHPPAGHVHQVVLAREGRAAGRVAHPLVLAPQGQQHVRPRAGVLAALHHGAQELAALREADGVVAALQLGQTAQVLAHLERQQRRGGE